MITPEKTIIDIERENMIKLWHELSINLLNFLPTDIFDSIKIKDTDNTQNVEMDVDTTQIESIKIKEVDDAEEQKEVHDEKEEVKDHTIKEDKIEDLQDKQQTEKDNLGSKKNEKKRRFFTEICIILLKHVFQSKLNSNYEDFVKDKLERK